MASSAVFKRRAGFLRWAVLLTPLTLLLCGCAEEQPAIKTRHFFPYIEETNSATAHASAQTDAWTVSEKGSMAQCKARMAKIDKYLVIHVDVQNIGSDRPIQILKAVAYDREKTLLKTQHSSGIAQQFTDQAEQDELKASEVAANARATARDAQILQAINNQGAWGAALSEALAAAISTTLYQDRAATIQNYAEFVRTNGYQNSPVPKSFSNRGLISFIVSDRVPPYTIELTLTNRFEEEVLAFTFGEIRAADFLWHPEISAQDRESVFESLSQPERDKAIKTATKLLSDPPRAKALKRDNPDLFQLLKWVSGWSDWTNSAAPAVLY